MILPDDAGLRDRNGYRTGGALEPRRLRHRHTLRCPGSGPELSVDHVGALWIWFCGSATISCPDRRLSLSSCAPPHCGRVRWNSAATTSMRLARSVWSTDAKIAEAAVGAPAPHTGRHAAVSPKAPFQRLIKQAVKVLIIARQPMENSR